MSAVLNTFNPRLLGVFPQVVPGGFLLLGRDLLLYLGLLVELVEVVDDDWDGQGDTEDPTYGAGWKYNLGWKVGREGMEYAGIVLCFSTLNYI